MSKVTFDVSGSDPKDALARDFEQVKPGIWDAKVAVCEATWAKGDDSKPDKKRPQIKVAYQITDETAVSPENKKAVGCQVFEYIAIGPNPNATDQEWKLDQFLQAFGFATEKKRKGAFETEAVVGKPCRVRTRAGKDQADAYRADFAAVMPAGDSDLGDDDLGDDALDADDGLGDDALGGDEDGLGDDDGAEEPYTEESLGAMPNKELVQLAKSDEFGVDVSALKGSAAEKKEQLIALMLATLDEDPFA